ncbi:Uncharacterized protein Adt_34181 [Abeliophyllum distichum]|uniref:Transposase MuDR plant domain-containing protein n=1 Tax=Abeliophyllum distichum TaxID=126358 RepID=A0ABD1QYE0_9LAMI
MNPKLSKVSANCKKTPSSSCKTGDNIPYSDMDNVNIFINCNGESTGILVPISCTYVELVDLINSVLKLDKRSSALSIQYAVIGCLSSMKITNDNTLRFYLELKRKDQNLSSYPLQNDVTRSLESNNSCYLHRFVSSVCETIPDLPEVEIEEDNIIIAHPDFSAISEGRIFRDKNVLKKTISLFAIHHNFQYKVYRSDKEEYVLKCLDDNCMWHFRASRLSDTDLFKIRYIKNGHSCSMDYVMGDHRQATSSLLADCIKHKYMDAKTIYTPRDIINDASKTYGVTLSYGKAWRARESALEKIVGEPED